MNTASFTDIFSGEVTSVIPVYLDVRPPFEQLEKALITLGGEIRNYHDPFLEASAFPRTAPEMFISAEVEGTHFQKVYIVPSKGHGSIVIRPQDIEVVFRTVYNGTKSATVLLTNGTTLDLKYDFYPVLRRLWVKGNQIKMLCDISKYKNQIDDTLSKVPEYSKFIDAWRPLYTEWEQAVADNDIPMAQTKRDFIEQLMTDNPKIMAAAKEEFDFYRMKERSEYLNGE